MSVNYFGDVEQGSEEWLNIRKLNLSGTDAHKVYIGWTKEKILTDKNIDTGFTGNYYTRRGHMLEPLAVKTFEQIHNIKIEECGYITNNKYEYVMYSPDGFNKKSKLLIEIKGFMEKHHLECIKNPDETIVSQIAWGIMVGEFEKAVLINVNPDCEENQYNETWFNKDDEIIVKRIEAYKEFLKNDGKAIETSHWNEECKDLITLENEIANLESDLIISDNGKEFSKYLELTKSIATKRKTLQENIKNAMIKEGYKTIENEFIRATLSNVTKFKATDIKEVPDKFTKKTLDTAKVKTAFNKDGVLPVGTEIVYEHRLNLKNK